MEETPEVAATTLAIEPVTTAERSNIVSTSVGIPTTPVDTSAAFPTDLGGAVGTTPTGEATYTLPLWTPPHIAANVIDLALTYNSNARTSVFGAGWSMSGLPGAITQCPKTLADHGLKTGVVPGGTNFCFGGVQMHLVPGSGTGIGAHYGLAGAPDTTRIIRTSFTKWTAHLPSGHVVEYDGTQPGAYSGTPNSSAQHFENGEPYAWYPTKKTFGMDEIAFHYDRSYLTGISYGGSEKIRFAYEDLAAPFETDIRKKKYQDGQEFADAGFITEIVMGDVTKVGDHIVYELDYSDIETEMGHEPTVLDRRGLRAVRLKTRDGAYSRNLRFDYQPTSWSFDRELLGSAPSIAPIPHTSEPLFTTTFQFDHDPGQELLTVYEDGLGDLHFYVSWYDADLGLSRRDKIFEMLSGALDAIGLKPAKYYKYGTLEVVYRDNKTIGVRDLDGDGRDELLFVDRDNPLAHPGPNWAYGLAQPWKTFQTIHVLQPTDVDGVTTLVEKTITPSNFTFGMDPRSLTDDFFWGDYDGDGRQEAVICSYTPADFSPLWRPAMDPYNQVPGTGNIAPEFTPSEHHLVHYADLHEVAGGWSLEYKSLVTLRGGSARCTDIAGAADYDGDGKTELVIVDPTHGIGTPNADLGEFQPSPTPIKTFAHVDFYGFTPAMNMVLEKTTTIPYMAPRTDPPIHEVPVGDPARSASGFYYGNQLHPISAHQLTSGLYYPGTGFFAAVRYHLADINGDGALDLGLTPNIQACSYVAAAWRAQVGGLTEPGNYALTDVFGTLFSEKDEFDCFLVASAADSYLMDQTIGNTTGVSGWDEDVTIDMSKYEKIYEAREPVKSWWFLNDGSDDFVNGGTSGFFWEHGIEWGARNLPEVNDDFGLCESAVETDDVSTETSLGCSWEWAAPEWTADCSGQGIDVDETVFCPTPRDIGTSGFTSLCGVPSILEDSAGAQLGHPYMVLKPVVTPDGIALIPIRYTANFGLAFMTDGKRMTVDGHRSGFVTFRDVNQDGYADAYCASGDTFLNDRAGKLVEDPLEKLQRPVASGQPGGSIVYDDLTYPGGAGFVLFRGLRSGQPPARLRAVYDGLHGASTPNVEIFYSYKAGQPGQREECNIALPVAGQTCSPGTWPVVKLIAYDGIDAPDTSVQDGTQYWEVFDYGPQIYDSERQRLVGFEWVEKRTYWQPQTVNTAGYVDYIDRDIIIPDIEDRRTGRTRTTYRTTVGASNGDYGMVGKPWKTESWAYADFANNGQVHMAVVDYVYGTSVADVAGAPVYLPEIVQSRDFVDGVMTARATVYSEYDTFGFLTKGTQVDTNNRGHEITTIYQHQADLSTGRWTLGLIAETHTRVGVEGVTEFTASSNTVKHKYTYSTQSPANPVRMLQADFYYDVPTEHLRVKYEYDQHYNQEVVEMTDMETLEVRTTRTIFYPNGLAPAATESAEGYRTYVNVDPFDLRIMSAMTDDGQVIQNKYDAYGRNIGTIQPGLETFVRQKGPDAGAPTNAVRMVESRSNVQSVDAKSYFDRNGRLLRSCEPMPLTGALACSDTQYDAEGRAASQTDRSTGAPSQYRSETIYDGLGRVLQVNRIGPSGVIMSGGTADFSQPLVSAVTSPTGEQKTVTFGNDGRMVSTQVVGVDALTFTYTDDGKLKTAEDSLGRKYQEITYDPNTLLPSSITTVGRGTTTIQRNAFGEVTMVDGADAQVFYTFDGDGRLTSKSIVSKGIGVPITTSYAHVSPQAPGSGQLWEVSTGPTERTVYSYNSSSRLAQIDRYRAGKVFTSGTTYDAFGRVDVQKHETTAGGKNIELKHTYDPFTSDLIRVEQVAPVSPALLPNPVMELTGVSSLGVPIGGRIGNLCLTREFNQDVRRITGVEAAPCSGGTKVVDQKMQYDLSTRLRSIDDRVSGMSRVFSYDSVGRLAAVSQKVGPLSGGPFADPNDAVFCPSCSVMESFGYDSRGRLTTGPGGAITYGTGSLDAELTPATVGGAAISYATDGSVTAVAGKPYVITSHSDPKPDTVTVGGNTTQFVYEEARIGQFDAAGNQRIDVRPGLTESFSGSGTTYEGSLSDVYAMFGMAVQMVETGMGQSYRIAQTDAASQLSAVFDDSASWRTGHGFTILGQPVLPPPTEHGQVTVQGGWKFNAALGLVETPTRLVDATSGLFLSRDPKLSDPTNMGAYPAYQFPGGDPINTMDWSGLVPACTPASGSDPLVNCHYTAPNFHVGGQVPFDTGLHNGQLLFDVAMGRALGGLSGLVAGAMGAYNQLPDSVRTGIGWAFDDSIVRSVTGFDPTTWHPAAAGAWAFIVPSNLDVAVKAAAIGLGLATGVGAVAVTAVATVQAVQAINRLNRVPWQVGIQRLGAWIPPSTFSQAGIRKVFFKDPAKDIPRTKGPNQIVSGRDDYKAMFPDAKQIRVEARRLPDGSVEMDSYGMIVTGDNPGRWSSDFSVIGEANNAFMHLEQFQEITAVKLNLYYENAAYVNVGVRNGMSIEDAIMTSPAGWLAKRKGFTEFVDGPHVRETASGFGASYPSMGMGLDRRMMNDYGPFEEGIKAKLVRPAGYIDPTKRGK